MMFRTILSRFVCGLACFLSLVTSSLLAQHSGHWQWHLAVGSVYLVQELPDKLLVTTNGMLAQVDKKDPSQLILFDGNSSISDIDPTHLLYDHDTHVTAIYYPSGLIDLLSEKGVETISGLHTNAILTDKRATRLCFLSGQLFVAGYFGLMQIDVARREIVATAFPGRLVRDAFALGKTLYALTEQGLYSTTLDRNIQDPSQWVHLTQYPQRIRSITSMPDGSVWYIDEAQRVLRIHSVGDSSSEPEEMLTAGWAEHLYSTAAGLVVQGPDSLLVWRPSGSRIRVNTRFAVSSVSSQSDPNRLWIVGGYSLYWADLEEGASEVDWHFFDISRPSPSDNRHFDISLHHHRLYSLSGGRDTDAFWRRGSIKIYHTPTWINIDANELKTANGRTFLDPVSIAVDPKDPDHYFVGSWGGGLYEIQKGTLIHHFDASNSPLAPAYADENPTAHNVRVGSLCWDHRGTLWMAQGSVRSAIFAYTPGGQMTPLYFDAISGVNAFGRMLAFPNGVKWLLLYHRGETGANGVFVFDDRGTPHDPSDDESLLISSFVDRSGKEIAAKRYYDMIQDPYTGALWLATDKGLLQVANPSGVLALKRPPIATRPVGGQEPNLYYVLDNMPITAIAVDGIGNKWCGTSSDGLYLLSSDGTELLAHYTKDNSPLLTNDVGSLAYDAQTGNLYIATSAGLVSYYAGVEGQFIDQSKQSYIYPNPLGPDDPDLVTIADLPAGCSVRVFDSAGQMLYQGVAHTGELSFSARLANGERYPSGVYQVVFSDSSGKHGHTLSFVVIH